LRGQDRELPDRVRSTGRGARRDRRRLHVHERQPVRHHLGRPAGNRVHHRRRRQGDRLLMLAPTAIGIPGLGGVFGGVRGIVKSVLTTMLKLLFGLPAKATVSVMVALVAHPVYTDTAGYGPLNAYRAY